jgi:hypothetical protein
MVNHDFLLGFGAGKAAGGGGGGGGGNTQVIFGVTQITTAEPMAFPNKKLTVAETGTYSVYWVANRYSSGGNQFIQMYIDGVPYGEQKTSFPDLHQAVELTEVSLTKNQTVELWGSTRDGYWTRCYIFEIVQTS